ncbi:putative fucose kinase [Trypanosoma cruzi]|nr:putative fucose kinase [Trypanosoma cruzi]
MRLLLSVPLSVCEAHGAVKRLLYSDLYNTFFTCDPKGSHLGSGGGTSWLLERCYQSERNDSMTTEDDDDFEGWLLREQRIIIHSGGQSRRLPSYGPCGKLLLPVPVFRWSRGQTCDQTLLDLQMPLYEEVMRRAPSHLRTLVSCGDVLILLNQPLPPAPEDADVVCYAVREEVDRLRNHGVFFLSHEAPDELDMMLQKPSIREIHEYTATRRCVMDIGLWLLSDRAVRVLRTRSMAGNRTKCSVFADGFREYDLYGEFGLALGKQPLRHDPLVQQLRVKIVTLPEARFFHYGTTEDMIFSTVAIQNTERSSEKFLRAAMSRHPAAVFQNARVHTTLAEDQRSIWVENSEVSAGWSLQHHSVITGVPRNTWTLHVPAYVCIDVVPVRGEGGGDKKGWVARPYGFNDAFRGYITGESTEFLGMPIECWLRKHDLRLEALTNGNNANMLDIQCAALFPWCATVEDLGLLIRWMIDPTSCDLKPSDVKRAKGLWEMGVRYSANELNDVADITALLDSRESFQREILPIMAAHAHRSPFYQMDLNHTAQKYAAARLPLPGKLPAEGTPILHRIHHHMFCARVLQCILKLWEKSFPFPGDSNQEVMEEATKEEERRQKDELPPLLQGVSLSLEEVQRVYGLRSKEELAARAHEEDTTAFHLLQTATLQQLTITPSLPSPQLSVYDDQIVWGRGPARIDLSGGWTDTPPYTNLCGGNVVNVAIELNGQPPLQVYLKPSATLDITLCSIDLGSVEKLSTFEELRRYNVVGSPFSIPKAALAMAGFLPEFGAKTFATLQEQLKASFRGHGVEITLLVAIPAGSGLGSSSLLAATVLSALSDFCGLGWDAQEVGRRTLCLEQLLTTGGGWQDQYGGLYRGLKLLQSSPGLCQNPCVRWLPEHLLEDPRYAPCHLLYFTGITRMSKVILTEIVRGMFMNSASHLRVLSEMRQQALDMHDAITRGDFERYGRLIGVAWEQNKRLDSGSCPEAIADIISRVEKDVWGLKLAGAGGGGYLYMVAKDVDAAQRIRHELTQRPPNATARFVGMSVSHSGIKVSRS